MTNQLIPRLRFKQFNEQWYKERFTNFTKILNGLSYSPKNIRETGTFVIRSSNINNNQLVNTDNVYVDNNIVNSPNVKKHDIAIVVRNGSKRLIGKHALINNNMKNTVIGAFMSLLRSDNALFVNTLLSTNAFRKSVHASLGATINQITKNDFKLMKFYIPTQIERKHIGVFFAKLDHMIELQDKKVEHLTKLKKGYLQKMFPQKGENVPRLRFNGFHDEWNKKKLKDLGNVVSGGDVKKSNILQSGKYPVIANNLSNNGIIGYYNNFYKVDYPSVTITARGSLGVAKARNYKYTPVVRLLVFKTWLNIHFTELVLNIKHFFNESTGVPQLTSPQLKTYSIKYPSIQEQNKIGQFFKNFDQSITKQDNKLTQLKQLKKAYLQKMFI